MMHARVAFVTGAAQGSSGACLPDADSDDVARLPSRQKATSSGPGSLAVGFKYREQGCASLSGRFGSQSPTREDLTRCPCRGRRCFRVFIIGRNIYLRCGYIPVTEGGFNISSLPSVVGGCQLKTESIPVAFQTDRYRAVFNAAGISKVSC